MSPLNDRYLESQAPHGWSYMTAFKQCPGPELAAPGLSPETAKLSTDTRCYAAD